MLLSMTGHGQSLVQNSQVRVLAEVRSVNNRFLKTNVSCDLDASHQSKLENLIKKFINRGSVNLKVKSERLLKGGDYKLNDAVIRAYWLQLSEVAGSSQSINVESLLQLPGVVQENVADDYSEVIWPSLEQAVTEALQKHLEMRSQEGAVMQHDMRQNCTAIRTELAEIQRVAPRVIENYSQKIIDRIKSLLEKHDISVQPADVIKEVGIFAERVDISEEIVRLSSHLNLFDSVIDADESNGRKLDFLVQEMLRETNTIGSKANDADIASRVVSIKTSIERIREMVQNVE